MLGSWVQEINKKCEGNRFLEVLGKEVERTRPSVTVALVSHHSLPCGYTTRKLFFVLAKKHCIIRMYIISRTESEDLSSSTAKSFTEHIGSRDFEYRSDQGRPRKERNVSDDPQFLRRETVNHLVHLFLRRRAIFINMCDIDIVIRVVVLEGVPSFIFRCKIEAEDKSNYSRYEGGCGEDCPWDVVTIIGKRKDSVSGAAENVGAISIDAEVLLTVVDTSSSR